MREVGKGLEGNPPHIRQLVKIELMKRQAPECISVVLLLCHEVYDTHSVALIECFAGCETFVEGQEVEKYIFCCRFDVNMAIYQKEFDDGFKVSEADEFGKVLVAKRRWNQSAAGEDFKHQVKCLDEYLEWAEKLDDCKMKAYFTDSLRLLKKNSSWDVKTDEKRLIDYLKRALDQCKSAFGVHWLTIDCHTQLGKLYWGLHNMDAASASFKSALDLAECLSGTGNRRYLSCLVDKGRFLVESGEKESIEKGKRLIDEALAGCKDFPDEIMWLLAMKTLMKVDKAKREEMFNLFLVKDKCNYRWIEVIKNAIIAELDSLDENVNKENFMYHEKVKVERLQKIIARIEYLVKNSKQESDSFCRTARSHLYFCTMLLGTRCMHVLSESDARKIATEALDLMKTCCSTKNNEDKEMELSFIVNCDEAQYKLFKRKCCIVQLKCRIPGIDLEEEMETLLDDCKKYEYVLSRVSREFEIVRKKSQMT